MSRPVYLPGRGRGRGRGVPNPNRGGPPPGYSSGPFHPNQHWTGPPQQWMGPGTGGGGQQWGGPSQQWGGGGPGPQWSNNHSHRPQLPPRLQQKHNGDAHHRSRWEQGGSYQRNSGQYHHNAGYSHHHGLSLPSQHKHSQHGPPAADPPVSGRRSMTNVPDGLDESGVSADTKFHDAATKHQQSVQLHLTQASRENYESSSEEEDLNDTDIMSQTLRSYHGTGAGESETNDLGRTREHLINSIKAKANACLICIETIKRTDPVWHCETCYTMFHITCIQKWVKDGVYQQTAMSDEEIDTKSVPWNCPKCRHEYPQSECPTRYLCFCGKEEDPEFDPWLLPHSCGQTCGRQLQPECGHQCLLLCHPGPCPPCPQTVLVSCHCGKQSPQIRRCGAKDWSCGQKCDLPLTCGHHKCQVPCHGGDCPACPETSVQPCQCGDQQSIRPCASPTWQCEKVCGRTLGCGNHVCERVCHKGACGSCPRSGKRSCPCGKTEFDLPCMEDVPTCVDTCGKLLSCGLHTCSQKCHFGDCGVCRQMTMKRCRCGQRQKELPCNKEYQCETKCPKIRDCQRHPCKRKCCDGTCLPCDKPCARNLGCRNHKCASRCHRGPCYPCPETVTITCFCKDTSVTVPCGRERYTKPPKCSVICKKTPDCHHPTAVEHPCHFGMCPPCRQTCGKPYSYCGHTCSQQCHSASRVRVQEKSLGPWDPKPQCRTDVVNRACPPCSFPVQVSCLGNHETVTMPCSSAKVESCHRPCNRVLACTNHTCQLECHLVEKPGEKNGAGMNCGRCEETCQKRRPVGCTHICLRPCHPGDCERCSQMIRMRCHCKAITKYIECYKWTAADDDQKADLKACPGRCPKMLDCDHQCRKMCHAGACTQSSECAEKVRLSCKCRRRKRDFRCHQVQVEGLKLECDDVCKQNKEKKLKEAEAAAAAAKEEELRRHQVEVEEFERKLRGRKRKPRRQAVEEDQPNFLRRHSRAFLVALLVAVFAVVTYYMISME